MQVRFVRLLAVGLITLWVGTVPAAAQITTGTVTGTIKDSQGGVVPGATVVLISEARGTRSVPAVTNASGDYVFPNTTADTYTVEVTLAGFRTLTRAGVMTEQIYDRTLEILQLADRENIAVQQAAIHIAEARISAIATMRSKM